MTKYVESQLQEARDMRAAGKLWKTIKDATGVGRDVIHYHDKKKLKGRTCSLSAKEIAEAAERLNNGQHIKTVAAYFWVSARLIEYQVKKFRSESA
jgi:hypothetical protein